MNELTKRQNKMKELFRMATIKPMATRKDKVVKEPVISKSDCRKLTLDVDRFNEDFNKHVGG